MFHNGDLETRTASGSLILRNPVAYQLSANMRQSVEAKIAYHPTSITAPMIAFR